MPQALWTHDLLLLQWGAVLGASLAAAGMDVAHRKIPNRLTGPLFVAGWGFALWAGGTAGLLDAFLGCLLLATPFVILFLFAGGGAGDAKLMGAIGVWLGVRSGAWMLAGVTVAGLLLAAGWALKRRRARAALENLRAIARAAAVVVLARRPPGEARALLPETKDMEKVPYGAAVFAGALLAAAGVLLWRA
jgi:Flp pilus assembly protein protease CpaA